MGVMEHGFAENYAFAKGRMGSSAQATIMDLLRDEGCIAVAEGTKKQDHMGVDYIATMRDGRQVSVDMKSRAGGSSYWEHGEPELALETWSKMPIAKFPGAIGWTLDDRKLSDRVLFIFSPQDSDEAFLIPSLPLRHAFKANRERWFHEYRHDTQTTSDGWQSECVFVPASVVRAAVLEEIAGRMSRPTTFRHPCVDTNFPGIEITLRPYQAEAVEALFQFFKASDGNPLVVLPTGSGKSIVQAAFVRKVLKLYPQERIILVAHVRELLQQNAAKLAALWPAAPLGLFSAGLNSREYEWPITIAGIQSAYRHAALFGDVGIVIVDEAHLIGRSDSSMYRTFLDGLRERNPALKVVGMSATPYRLDSGLLTEGDDRLFTHVAYEASIDRLVREGYLCRLVSRLTAERADLRGVHTRGGDYVDGELAALMDTDNKVAAAVEETIRLTADRRKLLVFCCSVAHAEHVAQEFTSRGVPTGCVTGETPLATRDRLLADFDAGILRAMASINVLSTGFDAPDIDALVMLRPTLSTGLYVQQCGRGMRVHESKTNGCLVLDFAGNILQHGPVNDVAVSVRRTGGTPRYKECPGCHEPIPTGCRKCPLCGYVFPPRAVGCGPHHGDHASPLQVMSDAYADEVFEELGPGVIKTSVRYVVYAPHQSRPFKPATLQVTYHCCRREHFKEWVCFDHPRDSFPRNKAEQWWRARSSLPVPATVDDAAAAAPSLKRPRRIVVNTAGEYPRILACLELEEPTIDLTPNEIEEGLA